MTETLVATPDPEDENDGLSPGGMTGVGESGRAAGKKFRKVKVLPSDDGQFYYVAVDKKGEPLYTSETFTRKSSAINAARREHEGRNERFDYILEYENSRGSLVRETL